MTENKDLPAFPITPYKEFLDITRGIQMGLSKRELFAGFAMQGLLSHAEVDPFGDMKTVAEVAIAASDALLSELNKTKP